MGKQPARQPTPWITLNEIFERRRISGQDSCECLCSKSGLRFRKWQHYVSEIWVSSTCLLSRRIHLIPIRFDYAANSNCRGGFETHLLQLIPIHFESTVKPSFPRRRESTPWPHIYGGITVTWYNSHFRYNWCAQSISRSRSECQSGRHGARFLPTNADRVPLSLRSSVGIVHISPLSSSHTI